MIVLPIYQHSSNTMNKNKNVANHLLKKISELERKSKTKLNINQKILLIEIGTVEQMLAILVGCSVKVKVIDQKESKDVIVRESLIINKNSNHVLIRAISHIFIPNLPISALRAIRRKQLGIGTVIHKLCLETFRKILEIGYDKESGLVFRRYLIIYKKKIAFDIREEFII